MAPLTLKHISWRCMRRVSPLRTTIRCFSDAPYTCYDEEFKKNYIPTSCLEKLFIGAHSGVSSLINPARGDMVAAIGDIVSTPLLQKLQNTMRESAEGCRVLRDRPLINASHINYDRLRQLPTDTVGYNYMKFMDTYGYHMHEREPVHYIDDPNLAYVMTRYRQLHDFNHILYDMNTSVEAEVTLKAIELVQTCLPVAAVSAVLGPLAAPVLRINNYTVEKEKYNVVEEKYTVGDTKPTLGGLSIEHYIKERGPAGDEYAYPCDVINVNTLNRGIVQINNIVLSPCGRPWATFYSKTVLHPQRTLVYELLPWAMTLYQSIRVPLQSLYIEEWFDRPLSELRDHCGVLLVPNHLEPYTSLTQTLMA